MKAAIAAVIALVASMGPTFAEQSDRSAFVPLNTKASVSADGARRAATAHALAGRPSLAPLQVSDVDKNGDGRVGFDELLQTELKTGF